MRMMKKLGRLGEKAPNSHDSYQPPPTCQSAVSVVDDVQSQQQLFLFITERCKHAYLRDSQSCMLMTMQL